MGGVTLVFCGIIVIGGLITSSMVETRKRKNKRDSDDKSLVTGSSQSDDAISHDVEVDTRPKPKRKKEDVESSNATKIRRSSADSGPHACRFCGQEFQLSQALGGHMNRHRSEKQDEEIQKAETLVAQRQQYIVSNPWTMQGGGGGGNPYYGGALLSNPSGPVLGTSSRQFYVPNQSVATLQNPQLNQVLAAQQNAPVSTHSLQGGYHNPLDNTRTHYGTPSQRNIIPTGQFQGLHTPDLNFAANLGQHPVQTVYSDSKGSVLHSEADTRPPHGHSIFHSNQGGLSDTLNLDILNMPSNHNQQAQPNIAMASDHSFYQSDVQFVDQHGNPLQHEFQPGHDSQALPQHYTQTSLHQKLGSSAGSLRNESASISSGASTQGAFGMPSFDGGQDFQGGTNQSTTLMESGQAGFETDTSIDDHTSRRLL